MANATWDEVRRLACDFAHVQFGSNSPKLTEHNCIKIVSQLCQQNLLDVLHTCDGKSFLTPEELAKEIYQELQLNGGRVNLVDLRESIDVEVSLIEIKAREMVSNDSSLQLILGQLISARYIRQLVVEIRDILSIQGHLTFGDMAKLYNLPTEFVSGIVGSAVGASLPDVHVEGDTVYTEAFIAQHQAQLRGYFSAVIRPVSFSSVASQFTIHERLVFRIVNELIQAGRVNGSVSASHGVYTPEVFKVAQERWVKDFYLHNGYVDHGTLRRLGIGSPKLFLQKMFPDNVHLGSSCLSDSLVHQLTDAVSECVRNATWVDLLGILPSGAVSSSDLSLLVNPIIAKGSLSARLITDSVLISNECFERCRKLFDPIMVTKAKAFLLENPDYIHMQETFGNARSDSPRNKRDRSSSNRRDRSATNSPKPRRQRAVIESPNGRRDDKLGSAKTQGGYEYRMKAVKNRLSDRQCLSNDVMDDEGFIIFMSSKEIEDVLQECMTPDAPDELITELTDELARPLLKTFQEVVKSVFFDVSLPSFNQTGSGDVQGKLTEIVNSMRLYEKGAVSFPGELRSTLLHHLLRTCGGEVVSCICAQFALKNGLKWTGKATEGTYETRHWFIDELSPDIADPLRLLNDCTMLTGEIDSLGSFLLDVEDVSRKLLGCSLKKWDRKREKTACSEISSHLEKLLNSDEDLDEEQRVLTAVELLSQGVLTSPVSAPLVALADLIEWLKPYLSPEKYIVLSNYEELTKSDCVEFRESLKHVVAGWRRLGRGTSKERDFDN